MEKIITNKKTKNTNDLSDRRKTSSGKKKKPTKKSRRTSQAKTRYHSGSKSKKPITEHSAGDG